MGTKPRKCHQPSKNKIPKKHKFDEKKEIAELESKYKNIDVSKIKTFDDLPLSLKTKNGLKGKKTINSTEVEFINLTDIQKHSIGLALAGNDILAAAKTGSGKTLAFLIPVLERLYCAQWTPQLPLGAMIISPTRELATQIYNTLRAIGEHHNFSAALIIGGQNYKYERKRIGQVNIMIGTPGRLLQHLDINPSLDCDLMKILVLDEADRCLDMGFENEMNAIIEHLPVDRQTLLFSATQTKSVKDLVRLSLKNPMYVSVHERSIHATPETLQQKYTVCKLEDKITVLWSFIKAHKRKKLIVFFSTCKEVKFIYDVFYHIAPGLHLTALHGKLSQPRRTEVFQQFCHKPYGVLLATDIAARGLDFPRVDWVVQMDCPEDTNTYIHRVGRTARCENDGESLLVLIPSEIEMVKCLENAKIPLDKVDISPNQLISIQGKLESALASDDSLRKTAQRAFICYMRSIYLMKNKQVFDITALDPDAYAKSLGLLFAPKMTVIDKVKAKKQIKLNNNDDNINEIDENILVTRDSDDEEINNDENLNMINKKTKQNKVLIKKDESISEVLFNDDDSDDDELLTVQRSNIQFDDDDDDDNNNNDEESNNKTTSKKNKKPLTKPALAKKILKKKIKANTKITFNDDGTEIIDENKTKVSELARKYEEEDDEKSGINIEHVKKILEEEDKIDKQRHREKVKAKHREEKRKLKAELKANHSEEENNDDDDDDDDDDPRLASASEDDDSDGPDLSWLPDPDEIYGPEKKTDEENNDSDDEVIEQVHRPSKRKMVSKKDNKINQKKQKIDDITAAEELALQFLNN